MNSSDAITWTTGLLQLSVACYALRLNRLFGMTRVGWSLFCAFSLLTLMHTLQSAGPLSGGNQLGVNVDVMYAFISLLLLIGMTHLEALLKERLRVEFEEQRIHRELESRVKARTEDLIGANEELRQEVAEHKRTTAKLEAEVAERKRLAAQMEHTYKELLTTSKQAGMTEVATNVLHNVGNVLNSGNISASLVSEHVMESKAPMLPWSPH